MAIANETALLRMANTHLDNLYVHDELTGLFNRFGLERFGGLAYDHLLHDFGHAHIHFVDVDYMKGINGLGYDNGHNYRRWTLVSSPTVFQQMRHSQALMV